MSEMGDPLVPVDQSGRTQWICFLVLEVRMGQWMGWWMSYWEGIETQVTSDSEHASPCWLWSQVMPV
jgi:hypothetical protein